MQKKMSFRSVFIRNEFKALKGRYNSTIVYLFIILFITFTAFGFTKSTLLYQQKLSADPFSNWINLDFHSGTRDSLRTLNFRITDERFREKYHIKGAYFYNKGMVAIRTFSQGEATGQYEARTIDPNSGVVDDLLRSNQPVKYFPDSIVNAFKYEPNGVIISEKLREDIGQKDHSLSFVQMKSAMGDFIPVPLLGVVKELPDQADVIYTNLFYCKSMNAGFYDRENPYYRIFVEDIDTAGILRVLDEVCKALEIRDPSTIQTTVLKTTNPSTLTWKIEIGSQSNEISAGLKNERIVKVASLKGHHAGQYFELSKDTVCDNSSFFHDYLAIEFRDLEKISVFSKFLKEEMGLQLNLEVLSQRENYLFTGNIAAGSILLLMAISIISVSIYISGIIRNHLLKIKKNLGNFLAFGVKDQTLVRLYIYVAVRILATAILPAMMLAYACGELFEKHLLGKLFVIDAGQDYFSLFNSWFAVFLALIMFVAVLRTFISVKKILTQTPGDLVYERDK
jgi:hypothetical protein